MRRLLKNWLNKYSTQAEETSLAKYHQDYNIKILFEPVANIPVPTAPPVPENVMTPTQFAAYERWLALSLIVEDAPLPPDDRNWPYIEEISRHLWKVIEGIEHGQNNTVSLVRGTLEGLRNFKKYFSVIGHAYALHGTESLPYLPRCIPAHDIPAHGVQNIVPLFERNSKPVERASGRELLRILEEFTTKLHDVIEKEKIIKPAPPRESYSEYPEHTQRFRPF